MRDAHLPLLGLLGWGALASLAGCSSTTDPEENGPTASAPSIEFFVTDDASIQHGDWTRLRWKGSGASVAKLDPGPRITDSPNDISLSVRPHEPTTYTLVLQNEIGDDSATVHVDVRYLEGIYVDSQNGNDSRSGRSPTESIATLDAAMAKLSTGGTVFLTTGDYPTNVSIVTHATHIYGGRSPVTFLEDADQDSRIVPLSGNPIVVRDQTAPVVLRRLEIIAPTDAEVAVDVRNTRTAGDEFRAFWIRSCKVDGGAASGGTGIRVADGSTAFLDGCRIRGGRTPGLTQTTGIHVQDTSNLLVTNCFVDGGTALQTSSGVLVETTGDVRIGLNTISAKTTPVVGSSAAAIRIRTGRPAIGGNILFCPDGSSRIGVKEECDDCDPTRLEANLFTVLGVTLYDDYPGGPDPMNEDELNDYALTTQGGVSLVNVHFPGAIPRNLFSDHLNGDFHLKSPLPGGDPNPAIDGVEAHHPGSPYTGGHASSVYGSVRDDIDEDGRPTFEELFDLGADEL
jgi:hypothetical protein